MKCIYPLILLETLSVVILGYILLILEFRVHLHLYWHSFYLTIQMLMVQAVDWMRRVQSPNCKGAEREGRAPCIKLIAANVFFYKFRGKILANNNIDPGCFTLRGASSGCNHGCGAMGGGEGGGVFYCGCGVHRGANQ